MQSWHKHQKKWPPLKTVKQGTDKDMIVTRSFNPIQFYMATLV